MKSGKWIWLHDRNEKDEYVVFSDEFTAEREAHAEISVAGDYAMYINGELAAFGQYADYAGYKVYDRIDLSKYIKSGKNRLEIVAWHIGEDFSTCQNMPSGLIYEIFEGEKVLACSKAGVRCALSAEYVSYRKKTITVQLGYSYTYDFAGTKREPDWKGAVEVNGFKNLYERPNQKLVLRPITEGVLVDKAKSLYDLGHECSGFLRMRFCAPKGTRIIVGYGEHIVDGKVRDKIDGRDFTVELLADGETDTFLGTFRRLGCRYLQITSDQPVEIFEIGICEPEYPLVEKPFQADNELRQKIYDVAVRTLKLCLHEHYEDCPWREQSMYIMDSRNQMLCGYYAFDNPECARSAIGLFVRGQKENGLFELCFPARVPITIPSFSLTLPTVVLEYTKFTRSTNITAEVFENLEKMMQYFLPKLDERSLFKTKSEKGIWHFYEWAGDLDGAFFSPDGSKKERDEFDSLINAFLAISCKEMHDLAVILNKFERAAEYERISLKISDALRSVFFDESSGLFLTYEGRTDKSALANALCILAGACPADKQEEIADKLAYGYDGWVQNTLSMDKFRYDALLAVNEAKYAPAILKGIDKTYSYMLNEGATSFWETIKGQADFALAGSLCHGWSALPVYYYRVLTGKREKRAEQIFAIRDAEYRSEYRDDVLAYIGSRSENLRKERDKILYADEEKKRKILKDMLGAPLCEKKSKKPVKCVQKLLLETDEMVAKQVRLEVMPGFYFQGILYLPPKVKEKNALIVALHGGGGTPERIGDLFIDSANYNHMVRRVLRPGTIVFAPQLLLWNESIFGSGYDRENINRRLVQQGGSITALELYCISRSLDYFENSEEVDPARMGIVGLSYGGMYALHAGALDTRFASTYSSCWFSDRRKHNWHDWVYFAQEKKMMDAEVASLVFPRRLFIEIAENDEAFPAADAKQEILRLKEFAEKCGYRDLLHTKVFSGKHELDTDNGMLEEFLKSLGV